MLIEIIESDAAARVSATPRRDLDSDAEVARRWRADRTQALVGGEPGTGRTTFLRELGGADARMVHAADLALRGRTGWLAGFEDACADAESSGALFAVEDLHLLPLDLLAAVLRRTAGQWRAFSCGAFSSLDGDRAALLAPIVARRELPPLRLRTGEIAAFVARFVGDRGVRFTASAIAALAAQPWPGNLAELRSVVDTTVLRRSAGDVRAVDLPSPYCITAAARQLTPLAVAERDAILVSLTRHAGNKSRVAAELGISRTTLYERLRFFGIAS